PDAAGLDGVGYREVVTMSQCGLRQPALQHGHDLPGLDGVGYREVVTMLQGRLSETALRDAILVSTRRYAKRQDTWFRNQLRTEQGARSTEQEVWMVDATAMPEVLAKRI